MGHYDLELIKKYPNKYNIKPTDIPNLKILDWEGIKRYTWPNEAMKNSGDWWCHLEGCQLDGKYNDESEFWIGFNKKDDTIKYNFTAYGGMCKYLFEEFYDHASIDTKYDLQVQVNAIRFITMLLDKNILGLP